MGQTRVAVSSPLRLQYWRLQMHTLVSALVPIIVVVVVGLIALAVTERFSPDALITTIVRWVVFALVLIVVLTRLLPLIG